MVFSVYQRAFGVFRASVVAKNPEQEQKHKNILCLKPKTMKFLHVSTFQENLFNLMNFYRIKISFPQQLFEAHQYRIQRLILMLFLKVAQSQMASYVPAAMVMLKVQSKR